MNLINKINYFASVEGNEYFPYLVAWLESLMNFVNKEDDIFIYHSEIDDFYLRLLKETYPKVNLIYEKSNKKNNLTREQKVPLKLKKWKNFLNKLDEGSKIIFLDIDLVFKAEPVIFDNADTDLVLTIKNHKWPLNTGVIGVTVNKRTKYLFKLWLSLTEKLVENKELLAKALIKSGGGSQHTLIEIIGRKNLTFKKIDKKIPKKISIEKNICLNLLLLPCNIFNCDKPDQNPKAKIIHYKGGWHSVFLSKGNFNNYRKFEDSKVGFSLIENTYQKGISKLQINLLQILSQEKYNNLINSNTLEKGGIYASEMAYFCHLVQLNNCDYIIESGTRRGYSTEILVKKFPDKKIITIDFEDNEDTRYAKEKLFKYKNLEILRGNAFKILPNILKKINSKSIALLVDGPKGSVAVKLVKKMVINHSNIKLVAVHDLKKLNRLRPSSARAMFLEEFDFVVFTDHQLLKEKSIKIDKKIGKYQEDYYKDGFYQESYGPTLGITIPTSRDRFINKHRTILIKLKSRIKKYFNLYK